MADAATLSIWAEAIRPLFPENAEVELWPMSNQIRVSWILGKAPRRTKKRSHPIIIAISRSVYFEYMAADEIAKRGAEYNFATFVASRLAAYVPERSFAEGMIPGAFRIFVDRDSMFPMIKSKALAV